MSDAAARNAGPTTQITMERSDGHQWTGPGRYGFRARPGGLRLLFLAEKGRRSEPLL